MAPQINNSSYDTSGYTPSTSSIEALKKALKLDYSELGTYQSAEYRPVAPHDTDQDDKPWIFQLSLENLQEIENAVAYFERTLVFSV